MKKTLRKYQFGSQGLASTPINPYTGFSPSISLQEPSSGLGMSKPLDYESNKPKTQLAPSSSILNKPSLNPPPTSTPYARISSKPTVSPTFTSTPSVVSPQRYASASVKPEAGAPKTAFGVTKTGLDQTKLQSSTTNMTPKTNTGATAAGGVAAGLNAIETGVETYRGYNPVTPGPTSLYNKREQGILKKINKERDAVTALSTTAGALGTAAGITAAIPVIGWGVGAGLAIGAAGTGIAAASTAASLDKQETNLGKRVNSRIEREKREAEGLRKTQEIESMMNSSNPLDIQNEMMSIEGETMRGKYGGRMPVYKMGGSRSYQEPNAELERGEVIMRNGGEVKIIKGDRHEEGGEDEYLAPGDFVWSDHLKYQGKSMAELYLMVKDNPEKVNQLKDLQEDLASKEEPSEYNDLPQAKCGGGLPKYQAGTPAATYRPYQLPTTESTTTGSFPFTRPQYNMFGQFEGGGTGMRGISMRQSVINQANAAAAAQALQEQKVAKAKASVTAKANAAKLAAAKAANVSPTIMPAISGQQPLPNSLPATLPTQSGPTPTVANVQSSKTGRAPGTYSKARTMLNEYGRYIPQLAGSLAQIGMFAEMENLYKDLTVPQAARVANSQFTALGRVNNQAAEDQIREMYQAQLADARYRGAGPGDASQGQMAYNRAVQAIAETQRGVMNTNVNLAAQEASMNMEDKQRREVFNADARNESINANRVASANFGVQKSGALAGAFGTMGTDISKSIADREQALAIYGDTTMNADRYGINNKEVDRLAKEAAAKKAKALGREATPQEELIEKVNIYNAMISQIG